MIHDLPKLILALSLIVGIGAVMGILVLVMKNKPESSVQPVKEVIEEQKKPDVTADWKIYESKKYGFSVKYPSDWKFSESEYNRVARIRLEYADDKEKFTNISIGSMPSFDDDKGRMITFEEMTEEIRKSFIQNATDPDSFKEKNIAIDKTPAYSVSVIKDGKYANGNFVLKEDEVFVILCSSENVENNSCVSVLNDLFSTVKFIEKVKTAFLGINTREVSSLTDKEKAIVRLPKDLEYGALILSEKLIDDLDWFPQSIGNGIIAGSPAEAAGLRAGDVVLEMNGEKAVDLEVIKEKYSPGDKLILKILRGGEYFEAEIVLAEFPESLKQ